MAQARPYKLAVLETLFLGGKIRLARGGGGGWGVWKSREGSERSIDLVRSEVPRRPSPSRLHEALAQALARKRGGVGQIRTACVQCHARLSCSPFFWPPHTVRIVYASPEALVSTESQASPHHRDLTGPSKKAPRHVLHPARLTAHRVPSISASSLKQAQN